MVHFIRKLIALLRQTFVADCPVCHKHFYGFHPYKEQIMIDNVHYRIACHRCVPLIEKESKNAF